METKIYLLLDSNNSIRYVGKTIRLKRAVRII